jgi:hypothetical protein
MEPRFHDPRRGRLRSHTPHTHTKSSKNKYFPLSIAAGRQRGVEHAKTMSDKNSRQKQHTEEMRGGREIKVDKAPKGNLENTSFHQLTSRWNEVRR